MKAYAAIIKGRFSSLIQYRAAAIAGVGTQIFWGLIKVMILQAFYAQATTPPPISLEQAFIFIWIGQALFQLLPFSIDKEIASQVRSGHVAYELLRPIDLYWHWFLRSLAVRLIPTIIRSLPLFFFAYAIFQLPPPVSIAAGGYFTLSLVLSVILATSITTTVAISLFWTISGEGILRLIQTGSMFLSGLLVPLPLFPSWMQPFLSFQPFRGILDIPIRLYSGVIPTHDASYYLLFQAVWTAIFIVFGRWLISRALQRIVIQGG